MKRLSIILFLWALFFAAGCRMVGILGTPTYSEQKVPAECRLSHRAQGGILVLVEQPAWLNADTDIRPVMTKCLNLMLSDKAGIDKKYLLPYEKLAEFRSSRPDFFSLRPEQLGAALGSKTVLLIVVDSYELYELPMEGYYRSSLALRSCLVDVPDGRLLWPASGKAKAVRIEFEAEGGGKEGSAAKLAGTAAHCIVRYFYDCPVKKFRTWGEKPDIGNEKW